MYKESPFSSGRTLDRRCVTATLIRERLSRPFARSRHDGEPTMTTQRSSDAQGVPRDGPVWREVARAPNDRRLLSGALLPGGGPLLRELSRRRGDPPGREGRLHAGAGEGRPHPRDRHAGRRRDQAGLRGARPAEARPGPAHHAATRGKGRDAGRRDDPAGCLAARQAVL